MDGPWEHYAVIEGSQRQITYDVTYLWNLQTSKNKGPKLVDTEVEVRGRDWGGGGVGGGMDEGGQKEQTSSYKAGKSWGCDVQPVWWLQSLLPYCILESSYESRS